MPKTTVKIEGLSELVDAFDEMSKATETNVQKRALMAAGDSIKDAAKSLAPKRTGFLEKSIDISTKLSPRQKSKNKKESKVEVYVGPGSMTRAITSEFGTVHESPHPFLRPAWDANKMRVLESIKDALKEEIEKARQRAARKAARILAKMKA